MVALEIEEVEMTRVRDAIIRVLESGGVDVYLECQKHHMPFMRRMRRWRTYPLFFIRWAKWKVGLHRPNLELSAAEIPHPTRFGFIPRKNINIQAYLYTEDHLTVYIACLHGILDVAFVRIDIRTKQHGLVQCEVEIVYRYQMYEWKKKRDDDRSFVQLLEKMMTLEHHAEAIKGVLQKNHMKYYGSDWKRKAILVPVTIGIEMIGELTRIALQSGRIRL